MTSSSDANLFPPSHFFNVWKQEEATGSKSREYGGCGSNSQPNYTNFAETTRDRCAGALAWWNSTFFFVNWGRFSSIHRQICPIIKHNTALRPFFLFPNSKRNSTFYVYLQHQKLPNGIAVCTDDNYSCQYDIKQIYFLATRIFC
jgi:hypothetical protein